MRPLNSSLVLFQNVSSSPACKYHCFHYFKLTGSTTALIILFLPPSLLLMLENVVFFVFIGSTEDVKHHKFYRCFTGSKCKSIFIVHFAYLYVRK